MGRKQLLQGVRKGRSYVVTSHGKPVAKISPVDESEKTRGNAREALLARLRRQPVVKTDRWTREELYEDVPSEWR
jgi:prevent-host-death family protein